MEFALVLVLLLMFWLLLIRPAQRRQKAQTELQRQLEAGSTVMLTSGIFGTLTDATDPDRVRVLIADGVEIEVVRGAIASVVPDPTETDVADVESAEVVDSTDSAEIEPVESVTDDEPAVVETTDRRGRTDGDINLDKS